MAANPDIETRLCELETRLAYQEATIETLNGIVTRQHDELDRLRALCRGLADRVASASLAPGSRTLEDDIPPHY